MLLCPWDFPSKNTGVVNFLLQRIFLTQGSSLSLLNLLHWQADSFTTEPPRKSLWVHLIVPNLNWLVTKLKIVPVHCWEIILRVTKLPGLSPICSKDRMVHLITVSMPLLSCALGSAPRPHYLNLTRIQRSEKITIKLGQIIQHPSSCLSCW